MGACQIRSESLQAVIAALAREFSTDRSGAIAITTGLLMTVFIGLASLSVDVANWYCTKQAMQSAADAAAVAAAIEQSAGSSASDVIAAANNDASANGFGPGTGATVAVTTVANPATATVTISQPARLYFSGLFVKTAPIIQVSAQAGTVDNGGPVCLLALSPNASGAINFNGNASVAANGCSLVANSTSSTAIAANGNAEIDTAKTCGPGGFHANGNVHFNPTPSHCSALADPLSGMTPPPEKDNSCQFNHLSFNGNVTQTLSPGVYCNGITINGNANITFQPGTYILRNGTFLVNGNANLTGTGVGFFLTGTGTTVDLNGNGTVHLSAPTSGPMAGLIFAQDPSAPPDSATHSVNGNGNVTYEGTFYFGRQNVVINGNGNANSLTPFTMMIADTLTFNGNGTLNLNSNFQNSNVPQPRGMNLNHVALMK